MTAAMELKVHAPWKESYDKTRQCSKKQRDHFPDKDPHSQSFGFSSSYVQMWELGRKVGWAPKNWCFELWFWKRFSKSPLDSKDIKLVNSKEN